MAISRRTFLGTTLAASATGVLGTVPRMKAEATASDLLVLENDQVSISLDRRTGCVESLVAIQQNWKLRGADAAACARSRPSLPLFDGAECWSSCD